MSIGAIAANPLVSIASTQGVTQDTRSAPAEFTQRAAISAVQTSVLPVSRATQLSFETIIHLQSVDDPRPSPPDRASAADKFLEEARKSPIERMREQILAELGLSEGAIARMSPEERRATEDKIRALIEERLRQANGVGDETRDSRATILEAAV